MATLDTLTGTADGTLDTTNLEHDAGTGTPYFSHFNDAPDGLSSDWISTAGSRSDGTYVTWVQLSDVNADFGSMDSIDVEFDIEASGFVNDTCTLTARVADSDGGTTWLTDESTAIADESETTRTQSLVTFTGQTGSKAQWNSAYIRFSWAYNRVTSADPSAALKLFGFELNGDYTQAAAGASIPVIAHHYKQMAGN